MQNDITALARPEIITMSAYRSARSELTTGHIWLDANESPWAENSYNRYPEPQPCMLISQLATLYGVQQEQLLMTRGSDEGIDLLVRLFCRAGKDKILICPPTYGMYQVAATIQGADVVEVPLIKKCGFSLNIEGILKAWQSTVKIIFLCSPNNPTGNILSQQDILFLCKKVSNQSIVVIDEAYLEFSKNESYVNYLKNNPNLIILRTLSKAYGLAAIRCGVTIADRNIINLLKKIIAPYPIAKPIIGIASKQLSADLIHKQVQIIIHEREKLYDFLSSLPIVKKVWKSETNFILFKVSNAVKIMTICADKGVVLRNRSHEYGLNNCIRVTVGLPDENKFLMEVLKYV